MKVYELIKQLTQFPADAEVMFDARIETDALVKEIVETKDKENTYPRLKSKRKFLLPTLTG